MRPKRYCRYCVVPCCKNNSRCTKKLFIVVPRRRPEMRKKWLELAKRDWKQVSPNSTVYFCEDHFDLPNDMENYMEYVIRGFVKRIRMKEGCVPSRFDCQVDKEIQSTALIQTDEVSRRDTSEACQSDTKNTIEDACDESILSPKSENECSTSATKKLLTTAPVDFQRNDEITGRDAEDFSWQKKERRSSCELESDDFSTTNYSQDVSMYTDDNEHNTEEEWKSEGYTCNECGNPFTGGRFTCPQCVDYDLCGNCASEGDVHREHYMLWVPPHRPPDEVEKVMQTLRSILNDIGVTVSLCADEDLETDDIKTEVKLEFEEYSNPLVTEPEQPSTFNTELKFAQNAYTDIKQEIDNDDNVMTTDTIQNVRTSAFHTNTSVPFNECEQDESLLIPITPKITKNKVRNTINRVQQRQPVQRPIQTKVPVTMRNTNLTTQMVLKPITVNISPKNEPPVYQTKYIMVPVTRTDLPIVQKDDQRKPTVSRTASRAASKTASRAASRTASRAGSKTGRTQTQSKTVSPHITGTSTVNYVQTPSLVIENMQISVAKDESTSNIVGNGDVRQVLKACPSTSKR